MKAVIWLLIGFGLLLLIGSRFAGGIPILLLGLVMVAGGVVLGYSTRGHTPQGADN
jgi:hypothetical protein